MESAHAEQRRVKQYLPVSDPRGLDCGYIIVSECLGARYMCNLDWQRKRCRRHVKPLRDCGLLSRVSTRESVNGERSNRAKVRATFEATEDTIV